MVSYINKHLGIILICIWLILIIGGAISLAIFVEHIESTHIYTSTEFADLYFERLSVSTPIIFGGILGLSILMISFGILFDWIYYRKTR